MTLFICRTFKFSLFGLISIAILICLYSIFDPFMVIRNYTDFNNSKVALNRDFISTEHILNNHSLYKYNSFIFGSSRTIAFRCDEWSKYLPKDAKPVMFDASGESIYGIYKKFRLLDSLGIEIENAIILICRDATFVKWENHSNHLFIKHYKLSGQSQLKFQTVFLKAYFNPKFLQSYYLSKFLGKVTEEMRGVLVTDCTFVTPITNEILLVKKDIELGFNPNDYYNNINEVFYKRELERLDTISRINPNRIGMLLSIKNILDKNKTNYKIIISPLYEQVKFNNLDLEILNKIFGNSNIFDYSGKNDITDNIRNYYENSHFRPHVGSEIFKSIHCKKLE
jgi:hypothetical protein